MLRGLESVSLYLLSLVVLALAIEHRGEAGHAA